MNSTHRQLSSREIEVLQQQGCYSSTWELVYISSQTQLEYLRQVEFCGNVKIGATGSLQNITSSLEKNSGIYNSRLVNCSIGDYCLIANVSAGICNYDIGDHVHIENVHTLAVEKISAFGNGTRIAVINESGGREIPIFAELDAQIAYILACFPERQDVHTAICAMIDSYVSGKKSSMGTIGQHCKISNCGSLVNICTSDYVIIDGASTLQNGTILASQSKPTFVGAGTIAQNFIIQEGSILNSQAIIDNCFIGQSVKIDKQFSAENCCFFANCEMMHGEACSIFAGPFTVSHHKSTLLIAGLYSFYNAGSGTNFSNHMYKLGPVHQGVLQRGCKSGSDSYLLWPAQIGAFTSIIGRHKSHMDTSKFPFSILVNKESSVILPGQNLASIGTFRDAAKWPKRDKRDASNKRDRIHYDLLNAFTIQQVFQGLQELTALGNTTQKSILKNGVTYSRASIKKGISLYQDTIAIFASRVICRRLQSNSVQQNNWQASLRSKSHFDSSSWVDVAGMLSPLTALEAIFEKIKASEIDNIEKLLKSLNFVYKNYDEFELDFVEKLLTTLHKDLQKSDTIAILKQGAAALQQQLARLWADAKKEFSTAMQTGYAVQDSDKSLAFQAIHGRIEDNASLQNIVKEIQNEIDAFNKTANKLEE